MKKPKKFNTLNKEISCAKLDRFCNLDEVKEYLLDEKIDDLLRDSHIEQIEYLGNLLDTTFKERDIWADFVEVTERRNIFVHCDGEVSPQYIERCEKAGVDLANVEEEDKLEVDGEYFDKAYNCLVEYAVGITHIAWRKLNLDEQEEADKNLVNIIYKFLRKKEYDLVKRLGEFAIDGLNNYYSEEIKLMHIVNTALAYKFDGNEQECKKIINDIDWRTKSLKFQLAQSVIEENFERAKQLMEIIGRSEEISRVDYREWPLFKDFKKTDVFSDKYREIFGIDFEEDTIANFEEKLLLS